MTVLALALALALAHATLCTVPVPAELLAALPAELKGRVTATDALAIGWLETRIPEELEHYPTLCRIAHEIIAEGLSSAVVQPGQTTTSDLQWWYRERIRERRLTAWFHPSVSVQRSGAGSSGDFSSDAGADVIRRGGLVHVDFGIRYLGLHTDTQQHAYVLRFGESTAPAGLVTAFGRGNRLQDLLTAEFETGRTGNDVLARTRAAAEAEGLVPSIYTHPLGYHGHGAGPLIGLWDQQGGVPGRGDFRCAQTPPGRSS
ncbi:MAG: aminopeptidase P family protein [bacterium]|nr:aminopeptidase P family protein [bacterium]